MGKINWWKTIERFTMIGMMGFVIYAFASTACGVSRSPLLKDPKLPNVCKIELECMYMAQNNPTAVGACLANSSNACAAWLVADYCRDLHPLPKDGDELKTVRVEKSRLQCRLSVK